MDANKMNRRVKRMWVKALREKRFTEKGRKFEQGVGALRSGNRFCCLGVLCELYVRETGDTKFRVGPPPLSDVYSYGGSESFLPWEVQQWAKLKTTSPEVTDFDGNYVVSLATLNDEGCSFEEIATLISKGL